MLRNLKMTATQQIRIIIYPEKTTTQTQTKFRIILFTEKGHIQKRFPLKMWQIIIVNKIQYTLL